MRGAWADGIGQEKLYGCGPHDARVEYEASFVNPRSVSDIQVVRLTCAVFACQDFRDMYDFGAMFDFASMRS